MILRDGERIIPNGVTKIKENDVLVLAAPSFVHQEHLSMQEVIIDKGNAWNKKQIKELSLEKGTLILLIHRDGKTIIPSGDDKLRTGDMIAMVRT